jgi:hypothetical protein
MAILVRRDAGEVMSRGRRQARHVEPSHAGLTHFAERNRLDPLMKKDSGNGQASVSIAMA